MWRAIDDSRSLRIKILPLSYPKTSFIFSANITWIWTSISLVKNMFLFIFLKMSPTWHMTCHKETHVICSVTATVIFYFKNRRLYFVSYLNRYTYIQVYFQIRLNCQNVSLHFLWNVIFKFSQEQTGVKNYERMDKKIIYGVPSASAIIRSTGTHIQPFNKGPYNIPCELGDSWGGHGGGSGERNRNVKFDWQYGDGKVTVVSPSYILAFPYLVGYKRL